MESSSGEGLICEYCHAKLPSQHALQWHHDQSAACRVVRAMEAAERRGGGVVEPVVLAFQDNPDLGTPPLGPFYDELAELVIEDDEEEELPLGGEDEVDIDEGVTAGGSSGLPKFDSAIETALWMQSAGPGGSSLPNRARNEWLKLMKDERYNYEEVKAKWSSHRDIEATILKAAVGDGANIINLQREGLDPEPIYLSYIPALDVIRKMFADVNNKKGFVLKPQVKVREVVQGPNGGVQVTREYDHPSTGTFWNEAQDEVDKDGKFVGPHIIVPIIVYLDKTTMDGLGRVSAFPVYISLGNFSWEVYNQKSGMQLVALLPNVRGDPDWKGKGYKPKSEGLKETRRFFMHWSMSIIFESARRASFTGFKVTDPHGKEHNAVPFIYVISKDLGEASSISGVRANSCDSCLVPPTELHKVVQANQGGYPARLEDEMFCVVKQMQQLRDDRAPQERIKELNREHGIHFVEPWFWDWNYSDRFWNNCYRKMAPDDLHTIFGGLLGHHFIGILSAVGKVLPEGEKAFLEKMDVRLHQVYLKFRPSGLRLPSNKSFFTSPCNTPAYEWKAILQVLPLMVVGICKFRGHDVLAEWAVAFCEWVKHLFWRPDGMHDDATLDESDRLLAVFEAKCKAIEGFQASRWCFRKMHETSKFTDFIRRCGSPRWFSTERGERRHHWVKKWWKEMNGKDISKALHRSWNNTLAIESVAAQRAELADLQRRNVYDSAVLDALDANEEGGENRLNKTELFSIYIPNLLVDPTEPDELLVRGYEQRRKLLLWLRKVPLLKELPKALALFFAQEDKKTPAEIRHLDLMKYLHETITDKIEVVNSCYVVPHARGRERLQQARASADYHGSVVLSDLAFSTADPVDHTWYGKAHLFFRAFQHQRVWDDTLKRRVIKTVPHELVFVRWYEKLGHLDATKCPQLEWARKPKRPEGTPYCDVLPIGSVQSVEMMVPKHTYTRGKRLLYRNIYFR